MSRRLPVLACLVLVLAASMTHVAAGFGSLERGTAGTVVGWLAALGMVALPLQRGYNLQTDNHMQAGRQRVNAPAPAPRMELVMRGDSTPIPLDDKAIARFWSKVDRSGGPDACWLWTGMRTPEGYGVFRLAGRNYGAHRVALAIDGRDPGSLLGCHSCDAPPCCNPAHLWLGTVAQNIADRDAKGRTASGERNGARLHPERLARGDMNGRRLHPERYPSGDMVPPDRRARGEAHGLTRLTNAAVRAIDRELRTGATNRTISERYGICTSTVSNLRTGKVWSHITGRGTIKEDAHV